MTLLNHLNLNARQRAMLKEMRIPFWWHQSPDLPAKESSEIRVVSDIHLDGKAISNDSNVPKYSNHFNQPPKTPTEINRQHEAPQLPQSPQILGQTAWLQSAQMLYANDLETEIKTGGWLIFTEAFGDDFSSQTDLLQNNSGRLLQNMFKAMKLHQVNAPVCLAGIRLFNSLRPFEEQQISAFNEKNDSSITWQILIEQRKPDLILLLLGNPALNAILKTNEHLGRLRGRVHQLQGYRTVASYSPAHLLRIPKDKAKVWEDLCLALNIML